MTSELSDDVALEDRVQRADEVLFSEMGDEVVMMSIEQGRYYALDDISTRVWSMIERPLAVSELCEKLTEAYDVSAAECRQDVLELLRRLNHHGLIRVEAKVD